MGLFHFIVFFLLSTKDYFLMGLIVETQLSWLHLLFACYLLTCDKPIGASNACSYPLMMYLYTCTWSLYIRVNWGKLSLNSSLILFACIVTQREMGLTHACSIFNALFHGLSRRLSLFIASCKGVISSSSIVGLMVAITKLSLTRFQNSVFVFLLPQI